MVGAQAQGRRVPSLSSHEFVPVSSNTLPMVNTKFNMYIGGGQTSNFYLPLFTIGDWKVIGLKGNILFVDAGIHYQQRVRDWLGVYVRYRIAARLGTEIQTVLAQGYNSINSFEIGWKFKLIEEDKFMLSTKLEMQNHTGNFVNILGFIKDIVNQHPSPSITNKTPVITGVAGIQFAYGINSLFGISAESEIAYGETYTRGENGIRFMTGMSFDINFNERFSIPIGVAVAALFTSQPEYVYVDGHVAKIVGWKIAYTGASEFNLGLEWSLTKSPMPGVENEPVVQTLGMSSRFYF